MLSAAVETLRGAQIYLASSLFGAESEDEDAASCSMGHELPDRGSSLDREWRLGLYKVLGQRRVCDLKQLFYDDTIKVTNPGTASGSLIIAGLLKPFLYTKGNQKIWNSIKCDVVIKLTLLDDDDYEIQKFWERVEEEKQKGAQNNPKWEEKTLPSLGLEAFLYNFMTQLVEYSVTPNVVIGLASYFCTVENILMPILKEPLGMQIRKNLEEMGVEDRADKARILMLERGRGETLADALKNGVITDRMLMSIVFQCIYTLDVLSRRGIRQGDLHTNNVFLDFLSDKTTEIVYLPFGAAKSKIFKVPTYGVVAKLYDFDMGGVYAFEGEEGEKQQKGPKTKKKKAAEPQGWPRPAENITNMRVCKPRLKEEVGACGYSAKADLYTLLSALYASKKTEAMFSFRSFVQKVIDGRLLGVATRFKERGGFGYRLCKGPIDFDSCDKADIFGTKDCVTGEAWSPPGCLMLSPTQMLDDQFFTFWEVDKIPPDAKHVYGNWPDEQTYKAFVAEKAQQQKKKRSTEEETKQSKKRRF